MAGMAMPPAAGGNAAVNAAAAAYRGVIPHDCWHEPYMPRRELDAELAAGVAFWGSEEDGALVGVMGIQPVRDVDLIRHAYVRPPRQRRRVGAGLPGVSLRHYRRRFAQSLTSVLPRKLAVSPSLHGGFVQSLQSYALRAATAR